MKKGLWIAIFLFVIGVGWWQWDNLSGLLPNERARRMVYPEVSEVSRYGGVGRVTRQAKEQILAVPKGVGRPVFVDVMFRHVYPSKEYEVTSIPEQEQLIYAVGRVKGWEGVEGSEDKYLIVSHPTTGQEEKYRVLMGAEGARLEVERVRRDGGENTVERLEQIRLSQLGYDIVKQVIRWGDAVILFPVFEPPLWAGRDERGVTKVGAMIVRRAGGAEELKQEIVRAGGGV